MFGEKKQPPDEIYERQISERGSTASDFLT